MHKSDADGLPLWACDRASSQTYYCFIPYHSTAFPSLFMEDSRWIPLASYHYSEWTIRDKLHNLFSDEQLRFGVFRCSHNVEMAIQALFHTILCCWDRVGIILAWTEMSMCSTPSQAIFCTKLATAFLVRYAMNGIDRGKISTTGLRFCYIFLYLSMNAVRTMALIATDGVLPNSVESKFLLMSTQNYIDVFSLSIV